MDYNDIVKLDNDISNMMFQFIDKATKYVDLTDDDYQLEKSIILNKISIQDYILNSKCCLSLKENNICDYSINELKEYFKEYDLFNGTDSSIYLEGLKLYELLEKIEEMIDSKISAEINLLKKIIDNIDIINSSNDKELKEYYLEFKNRLLNVNESDIYINILDDVFNFYLNGYPLIPNEYLV